MSSLSVLCNITLKVDFRSFGDGNGTDGKWEYNKANKEVFDWLLKNNENAEFANISRFDWLSVGFPVNKRTGKVSFRKAKISNCACPHDNFPVPVLFAKRTSGNPP